MGKNKLARFDEMLTFDRVIQPEFEEVFNRDHPLRGKWSSEIFRNNHPIVLELGCGKGEYTIGLAKAFPEKNYLGVDIKGARIWKGAKQANRENILNAAFLRTRIEFISSFFAPGEISEIWLTFPDPQLKKRRNKKRLSGPVFLRLYQKFLLDKGIIHLKTDNQELYSFTRDLARYNSFEILNDTPDLYSDFDNHEILGIKTFYESQYLSRGIPIKYLSFRLPGNIQIKALPDEE